MPKILFIVQRRYSQPNLFRVGSNLSLNKVFKDSTKTTHIYNEMWTGEWWNTVQVSVSWSFFTYYL